MTTSDDKIKQVLVEQKLLSQDQVDHAVTLAPSLGKSFIDTLIFKNLVEEGKLGAAVAKTFGVEYVPLKTQAISADVLNLIDENAAVTHRILPFAKKENQLYLAMSDPTDFGIINFIEKQTGLAVKPFFTFDSELDAATLQYKQDINKALAKIMDEAKQTAGSSNLAKVAEDAPTVKMFDTIMEYAFAQGASDVHIEGQEKSVVIRFRVDGILHDVLLLDKELLSALVARIKYLSNLKIDEHRSPQDGRFKYDQAIKIAVRVSIIPSFYGENVVMRLLPEAERALTLSELGFRPTDAKTIDEALKQTSGVILLTGPTGSGKTTTLYSLIEKLNKPEVKINTIEDPIEYGMPRVSQIQVNEATGLTFAGGLRALLRHDPNILMVGEIRDRETADICINAALTGHLVLSTLHTNDAPSSIPRLLDLNIEPFLLTATIRLVVAQRLVRRLCTKCAKPEKPSEEALAEVAKLTGFDIMELRQKQFHVAVGCNECKTGYKGRFVISEVFTVDDDMRQLILDRASNEKIHHLAIQNGMYTMLQDGVAKAAAGLTSLNEVLRQVRE